MEMQLKTFFQWRKDLDYEALNNARVESETLFSVLGRGWP